MTVTTDDYLGTAATTGRLTVGASVNGSVEAAFDEDWFAVDLEAGFGYSFSLVNNGAVEGASATGLTDPMLNLYGLTGRELTSDDDGGEGLNSLLEFTPGVSGTHYIGARGFSEAVGDYTLSLTRSGAVEVPDDDYAGSDETTGTIASRGTATGTIELEGDEDWFRAQLTRGTRYLIRLNQASGDEGLSDPLLRVYDGEGELIGENDDGGSGSVNSEFVFTPQQTGAYYLAANGFAGATGNYSLTLAGAPAPVTRDDYGNRSSSRNPAPGRLSVGSEREGRLGSAGDIDFFRVQLSRGEQYLFNAESAESTLENLDVRIHNNTRELRISQTQLGDYAYTATRSGVFYISVRSSIRTQLGDYTVYCDLFDPEEDDDMGDEEEGGETEELTSPSRHRSADRLAGLIEAAGAPLSGHSATTALTRLSQGGEGLLAA